MTERIAALNRFVPKSADKCFLLFKMLRGVSKFSWKDDCQKAFANLKQYLNSHSLLVSPQSGEILYIYLVASNETLAVVLVKETSIGQYPIYYVSKALQALYFNYSKVNKLAYSLLMASCRQYFQSQHIVIFTNQPFKEILQRMITSGRMVKWSIELS